MRARSRAALGAALSLVSLTPTAPAQQAGGLVADLLVDIGQVEEKLVGLAKAMPRNADHNEIYKYQKKLIRGRSPN